MATERDPSRIDCMIGKHFHTTKECDCTHHRRVDSHDARYDLLAATLSHEHSQRVSQCPNPRQDGDSTAIYEAGKALGFSAAQLKRGKANINKCRDSEVRVFREAEGPWYWELQLTGDDGEEEEADRGWA